MAKFLHVAKTKPLGKARMGTSTMTLTVVITVLSFGSLGGLMIGIGLVRLARLDRLRMQYLRQEACRLHRWQPLKGENALVCSLCERRSRRINPVLDSPPESFISGGFLP